MSKNEIAKLRKVVEQKLPAEAREKVASELRELAGRIALGDDAAVLEILQKLGEVFGE